MKNVRFRSVFDIIGPVMVGPSSSHTAGAARIGKIIRTIFGEEPESVGIHLYESFAKTYKGHGTDVALVAGLLGMDTDDKQLPDSLKIAYERGIKIFFVPESKKVDHPNTVKMELKKGNHEMSITGISIGGGNIQITEINGFKVHLSMNTPTIITLHKDVPNVVASVTSMLAKENINIGTLTLTRQEKNKDAMMIIELDEHRPEVVKELEKFDFITNVNYFE